MSEDGADPEFDVLGTLLEEDLTEEGDESEVHQTCRRLIEDVYQKSMKERILQTREIINGPKLHMRQLTWNLPTVPRLICLRN